MTLIRTSVLNGIAVLVRTLAAFLLNKILAVFVGPSGYASIGQLQNALAICFIIAGGAVNAGVTKYTAEHFDDEPARIRVWRAASAISAAGSALTVILLVILHRALGNLFFKDAEMGYVFLWMAGGIGFYVFNSLFLAILQGRKQIGRYVIANIGASVITLGLTGVLVTAYGLPGALISLAINQSAAFGVTVCLCLNTNWFSVRCLFGRLDFGALRDLSKFVLMVFVSAAVAPIAQVLIRSHLGESFGWIEAGYWEAMNRISTLFLGAVTATFSLYYLPRMAELRNQRETRKELLSTGPFVVGATAAACLALYVFRHWAITIAFDPSFAPTERLFAWQLTGDTLKMASWLFSYLMLARAMTKAFISIEIAVNLLYVVLVFLFTKQWGYEAATAAYAVTYLAYGASCAFTLWHKRII